MAISPPSCSKIHTCLLVYMAYLTGRGVCVVRSTILSRDIATHPCEIDAHGILYVAYLTGRDLHPGGG